MSLGGGLYTANCDGTESLRKASIDNLQSVGIMSVISSGNVGSTGSMGAPACISSAISVGSVFALLATATNADGGALAFPVQTK